MSVALAYIFYANALELRLSCNTPYIYIHIYIYIYIYIIYIYLYLVDKVAFYQRPEIDADDVGHTN